MPAPLPMQCLVTPFGTTYAYFHCPAQCGKPTILLLHGFLSSSYDWRHQIAHLMSLGCGVLAPDLLGFGQTSKPTDVYDYKLRSQCEGIICIMRRTRVGSVFGVGHDLGCILLSRLADWFPSRFLGYAFLGYGYSPAKRLDLKAGWLSFVANDKEAPKLMDGNSESVMSLFFTENEEHRNNLETPGATKHWLQNGTTTSLPGWMKAEDAEAKHALLRRGGFTGPVCWYKMLVSKINDKHFAADDSVTRSTTKPVLCVQGQTDPNKCGELTEVWAQNLTLRFVDTGHWMMLEDPEAINDALTDFLGQHSSAKDIEHLS